MNLKSKYSHQEYLEIRDKYEKQSYESSNRFDSTLLIMSGMAFGATIFFLIIMSATWMLWFSWGSLYMTMLVTLLSYNVSEASLRLSIKALDLEHTGQNTVKVDLRISMLSNIMEWLRLVGFIGLAFGMLFLRLFLFFSL